MELLTVSETSKLLKLSKNRIYILTKQGVIPSIRVGGSIRVVREDLENWIKGGGINGVKRTR
ncbi:DNA-binding protein [Geobacillus thermodenitrificans]|uniref:helix-turn-helix domain-containing protein n=1 Tax=Geobacillus thermodenitrificans TaxID=33940 RepID=UPI000C287412|nr:helix-turn-helix domain-containing protein [Geobacillus thermodenitrificans]PJW20311.1 DNA-binding protein [Geobacillus thermodenitrificans]